MFNSALPLLRSASRIQARSLLRPSTRNARDAIASAARGQHEQRSHGSQQSSESRGQGPRRDGRLPLRSTAVAGFSILAAMANSKDTPPQPNYAFKHPSGWEYTNTEPSLAQDFTMRYSQAQDINSIEGARSAHFQFTRSILQFCVHGEIIDEGSLPNDVVFGFGRYVAKEDTKIFWMSSPVKGRVPVLCLSVHHDLSEEAVSLAFVDNAIVAEVGASLLEKFNKNETYVYIEIHTPSQFFSIGVRRNEVSRLLERSKAWTVWK